MCSHLMRQHLSVLSRRSQVVEQCEDEELMDIVLPRLTKVMSLWELMLAKVRTHEGQTFIHTCQDL